MAQRYQVLASSISDLALFWEARAADNSLRTRLGLDDDKWKADDKNNVEPLPVSLIGTLVVREGNSLRSLTESEMLLLKSALAPFTPFSGSWLSIDLRLPVFVALSSLFESFLSDICGQFMAKSLADTATMQQSLAKINDWNGWKEQLFEHGVLTGSTLARGTDEKLARIFNLKASNGKFDAGGSQSVESYMTDEFVTDTVRTINEMTTLIVRSSGWKLMTRMSG